MADGGIHRELSAGFAITRGDPTHAVSPARMIAKEINLSTQIWEYWLRKEIITKHTHACCFPAFLWKTGCGEKHWDWKKNPPSYVCFIFRVWEKKNTKKSPGVPKSMNYGTEAIWLWDLLHKEWDSTLEAKSAAGAPGFIAAVWLMGPVRTWLQFIGLNLW